MWFVEKTDLQKMLLISYFFCAQVRQTPAASPLQREQILDQRCVIEVITTGPGHCPRLGHIPELLEAEPHAETQLPEGCFMSSCHLSLHHLLSDSRSSYYELKEIRSELSYTDSVFMPYPLLCCKPVNTDLKHHLVFDSSRRSGSAPDPLFLLNVDTVFLIQSTMSYIF